jgi:threonine dehydratase
MSGKVENVTGKAVCVLSGGNIDVKTISVVVERGLLAAGRYLKLRIELEDRPGALAMLAAEIAATNANISMITHDRRSKSLPIGKTEVLIELETRGYEHIQDVIGHLKQVGYEVEVLK